MLAKRLAGRRFFYGWYIVGVAFLVQWVCAENRGGVTSVFLKPMVEEMGWTRGLFSLVEAAVLILVGIGGIWLGSLLDKWGARGFIIIGALLSGVGMIALSWVNSLWQFYLVKGLVMALGALFLDRIVAMVAVANWFVRKRGRAISIAGMGMPLGAAVMLPLASYLVEGLGWRGAWVVMGLFSLAILVPPALLLMKRRPEDVGLLPDGSGQRIDLPTSLAQAKAQDEAISSGGNAGEGAWTRRQALASLPFWVMSLAFGFSHMTNVALGLHLLPFLTDVGLAATLAASILAVRALVGALSRPLWGLVGERFPTRHIAGGMQIGVAISLLGLVATRNPSLLFLAVLLNGLTMVGLMPIVELMWADYYGRASLGKVRGVNMPITFTFAAIGPLFAGFVYDITSSYSGAFLFFAALTLLGAWALFFCKPPRKQVASDVSQGL